MTSFDKSFQDTLNEIISMYRIGALLIESQLSEQNIILSPTQLDEIELRLTHSSLDENDSSFDISDLLPEGYDQEKLLFDLNNSKVIEKQMDELSDKIRKVIPEAINETIHSIKESLLSAAPEMLKEHHRHKHGFEERLYDRWGKALDLLETLTVISLESGQNFNDEYRTQAAKEQNLIFDVLVRLHARSCQIAEEVLILLRSGYADGAHARWRTLYELTVVALFIADKDNDTANRYLLHHHIDSYKAARQIRDHHSKLGIADVSDQDLSDLKNTHDKLIEQFGMEYKKDYGWAYIALETPKNQNPNFSDIERSISLEYMRPYYKLASHNVHANPKGILFKLGLLSSTQDIMLAGSSNAGLADPGSFTAISLARISVALLMSIPDLDRAMYSKIIWNLAGKCSEAFMEAHRNLVEETTP